MTKFTTGVDAWPANSSSGIPDWMRLGLLSRGHDSRAPGAQSTVTQGRSRGGQR